MTRAYRYSTLAFGLICVGLGIALFAETAARGGGSVGYLLAILFLALGFGRLYLLRRR